MSLPATAILAGILLALTVVFGWRGARGARPLAPPRMIPWRFMMMIAFALLVAVLVHLTTLLRTRLS